VVSKAYCVVFLFYLSSFCVLYTQCFPAVSLDCPFLIAPSVFSNVFFSKNLETDYFVFYSYDLERTWWRLFQKCVICTKLNIYVFIFLHYRIWIRITTIISICLCTTFWLFRKDKEVNKNVKNIFLSMCDVKLFLTFASLGLVLLWQLFYIFCSSIVINTVIVTTGTFEP
jgi:hypothetical protein